VGRLSGSRGFVGRSLEGAGRERETDDTPGQGCRAANSSTATADNLVASYKSSLVHHVRRNANPPTVKPSSHRPSDTTRQCCLHRVGSCELSPNPRTAKPATQNLSFLQILPTAAFLFFFRTDSTNSPDCLPILLSMSVFLKTFIHRKLLSCNL